MRTFLLSTFICLFTGFSFTGYSQGGEDETFYKLLRKFSKRQGSNKLRQEIPGAYLDMMQAHLAQIEKYSSGKSRDMRQNILGEYKELQAAFNKINGDSALAALLKPVSYQQQIDSLDILIKAASRKAAIADYDSQKTQSEKRIYELRQLDNDEKWNKLTTEYEKLQQLYTSFLKQYPDSTGFSLTNYKEKIDTLKNEAAEDYYSRGLYYLAREGRSNAKFARSAFIKATEYVTGYKDCKQKADEAFFKAVVNVVLTPVKDRSFYFSSGWRYNGDSPGNEYFQKALVDELNTYWSYRMPAKFYTEAEAAKQDLKTDWLVDLTLTEMKIPAVPDISTSNERRSARIETGRDTSGKVVFQEVFATIQKTSLSLYARAEMSIVIREKATGRIIFNTTSWDSYWWNHTGYTYTGDSRALERYDLDKMNGNIYVQPDREGIISELSRKLYADVRNKLISAAEW